MLAEITVMETNINYAAVGAFVIVMIAAFIMGIIWLSSGFKIQHYETYKIYMQESVTGLNIDSPVEFNGVDVGNVKSITIDHNNPQLVELLLDIRNSTPLTQGTTATLQTRGVTGVTYIALKDKSTDLAPLVAVKGERYPVIKTAPSLFVRLDTALSRLSDNLHDVTISVQQLLDKENQQNIKEILSNLRDVSGTLAASNARLERILTNTEKASNQFMPLMRNSAEAIRMFQLQTLPATYQLVTNLDNITRTLTDVAAALKQDPSILIRGIQHQPSGPGEK
jgi:phospholipid/cholesterol/gamma-HCH transport system substrate-binding protein